MAPNKKERNFMLRSYLNIIKLKFYSNRSFFLSLKQFAERTSRQTNEVRLTKKEEQTENQEHECSECAR